MIPPSIQLDKRTMLIYIACVTTSYHDRSQAASDKNTRAPSSYLQQYKTEHIIIIHASLYITHIHT